MSTDLPTAEFAPINIGVEQQSAAHRRPAPGGVRTRRPSARSGLDTFLGCFSIGLGAFQLISPRACARLIGVRDDGIAPTVIRLVGLREIACGVGIFSDPNPKEWLGARVAGDIMDLALISAADSEHPERTSAAAASVLGVTVLDAYGASRENTRSKQSERGGFEVHQAVTINRPVEEVYRFWRNFGNLPRFMRHLEDVSIIGEKRSHWTVRAPAGTTVSWDAEIIEERPNERIAWRSLPGADVDNEGMVELSPGPRGKGTRLRVAIRYNPPGGALGKAAAKLFGEEPAQQIYDDLRRLKQVLEIGEVVRSDGSSWSFGPIQRPAQPEPGENARLR